MPEDPRRFGLPRWQVDMIVLAVANFAVMIGFNLIMPFLPLYISKMLADAHGVSFWPFIPDFIRALFPRPENVETWSGLIFAINFVTAAIFSPIWGAVSDRIGRKAMMLRAGFGMGIVVATMGLATNVWHLLGLRALQGLVAGFVPAATAFAAVNTPRERTGLVLGVLSAGGQAGVVAGPLLGGLLAKIMGYQEIFFVTGAACAMAGLLVWVVIRENFTPVARRQQESIVTGIRGVMANPTLLAMIVSMMLLTFSITSVEPILSLFLQNDLHVAAESVAMWAGMIFSITGATNIAFAGVLGWLGDKIGYRIILMVCLAATAVTYQLQGLVHTPQQLLILRGLTGVFLGGLYPAANAMISLSVKPEEKGRAFGIVSGAGFVGNALGPLAGGPVGHAFGDRAVFTLTAITRLINLAWVLKAVPHIKSGAAVATAGAAAAPGVPVAAARERKGD